MRPVNLVSTATALAFFATIGGAQEPRQGDQTPTAIEIPATAKGSFDKGDRTLPEYISRKPALADVYTFTLAARTKIRTMLECESCLPAIAIESRATRRINSASHWVHAFVVATLDPGEYNLWVASPTSAGRDGAYAVTISDSGENLLPTLKAFTNVKASYQVGTKTERVTADVRIGWETVVIQRVGTASNPGPILKTFRFSELVAVEGSTTSKNNIGAAIAFGPAFAQSSHQQWVSVRTASDSIVLQVEANQFSMAVSELQRLVPAKK